MTPGVQDILIIGSMLIQMQLLFIPASPPMWYCHRSFD